MTLEDILSTLPSKEDLAKAVGYQAQSTSAMNAFGAFGTGVLLGAGLALLFAPKAGSELRGEITEKLSEAKEKIRPHVTNQSTQPAATVHS